MTSRRYPVLAQLTDAIGLLLLCVVTFPIIFMLADWARYS